TALVGSPLDEGGFGAVFPYTRTSSGFVWQGAKLVGADASGGATFGASIALSADGRTAIVGGQGGDNAIWFFTRSGDTWTPQGGKQTVDGAVDLGESAAIPADGNTALVGGPSSRNEKGEAWVFTRSGGVWTQGPSLVPDDQSGEGLLGWNVALSADGTTALV